MSHNTFVLCAESLTSFPHLVCVEDFAGFGAGCGNFSCRVFVYSARHTIANIVYVNNYGKRTGVSGPVSGSAGADDSENALPEADAWVRAGTAHQGGFR